MIGKRAFFPGVYAALDKSIYVLGGSESNQTDLNKCEKFSLVENVWRPISPMHLARNGTSSVLFDHHRLLFVFGGNSHSHGTLSQIEKYSIDFDKWTLLDIQLRIAVHDLTVMAVGGDRVLIIGGHTGKEECKDVQMVDLGMECRGNRRLKEGGKSFLGVAYEGGKALVITGYCDEEPKVEEVDIGELVINDM